MSKKLGSVTESVFEFIYNQNQTGIKLHEFDIISRFKNVIGYSETLEVLERLSKKKHLLRSTSTRTSSRGRPTYYYRVDPDNLYFLDHITGRKADPAKMKKLEAMRKMPFVTGEPVSDTRVVEQQIALFKPTGSEAAKVQDTWAALAQGKTPEAIPVSPAATNGVDVVGGHAQLGEVVFEPHEVAEAKGAVMLVLDLGAGRTEMVDAQTAHRLYRGLRAVFEKGSI
ncbi:MAG TPA: hypothetical protein VN922_20030 [Bacteroidia bacterium]|nr:hypothetical protein [Bacteroidia bacterium]